MALQVVRALCALDGSRVAAGSNDGFVRLWDASGKNAGRAAGGTAARTVMARG